MLQVKRCGHSQQFSAPESKVSVSLGFFFFFWWNCNLGRPTAEVSSFLHCRKLHYKSWSMSYSGCLHVNTHQVQTSKHPAQAAGDAPGNSWFGPTELCVFPGLLPSPGSKMLWLSQHCSLIYPLTLCLSLPPPCFSLSLSLSDTLLHLSLSLKLSSILSTSSPNEHILLSNICLNEQVDDI